MKRPIKKLQIITAACALSVSFLFSGCSAVSGFFAKAPEMEANAQSIKMYDSDEFNSMLINVNGRTYAPYGVVKKYMSKDSLRECLGYVDDDKDCRIYTLNEDPFDNYLIEKNVNGFMNPDVFWRDISTIEDDIFTPEYIESLKYEDWEKSGAYSEMKTFQIEVTVDAEDIIEIVMDYTINGDAKASAGCRNADYSVIRQGDVLCLEMGEYTLYGKYDKEDPFDAEATFSVITKSGETVAVEGIYKGTVKLGDKAKMTLTGNPSDGYKIG